MCAIIVVLVTWLGCQAPGSYGQERSAAPRQQRAQEISADDVPAGDWPGYRRDGGLTGFSPLVGKPERLPRLAWQVELGGVKRAGEQVRIMDLDGDGVEDLLRIGDDQLVCQSLRGRFKWRSPKFRRLRVLQIRDFAGDGAYGILIASSTGVEHRRHMVNGRTGQATLLYTMRNVFGGYERLGNILPAVKGEQVCAWWSGDPVQRFGGAEMRGFGYLWSFERGLNRPTRVFQATEVGTIYAPLHLFADMDLDGRTDMIMISHEEAWVFDLQSGKKTMQFAWQPRIRTYWANVAAVPLQKGERPALLMINPMLPGVQVVEQDGKHAKRRWKRVIGNDENQYQTKLKIDKGAPDPFVDLDGDGWREILVAVTNEHGDGKTNLVVYSSDDGRRLYEGEGKTVLTIDELDGQSPVELIVREATGALSICHFDGENLIPRWQKKNVTPIIQTAPVEGRLNRAVGARSSSVNMPIKRLPNKTAHFLLQFQDGTFACRFDGNNLKRLQRWTPPAAKQPNFQWNGAALTIKVDGDQRTSYLMKYGRHYVAPPPLVGSLGGKRKIVVREHQGTFVSYNLGGKNRRMLAERASANGATLVDLNGNGRNELLVNIKTKKGRSEIAALDEYGKARFTVKAPADATDVELGPTGRLGGGKGRWFVVRYGMAYANTQVTAYDGRTGKNLWPRDYLGPSKVPSTKFVLHIPTAVHDVDNDGADDLLASSENFYEVISVRDNRSVTANRVITAAVPGHWGAYATPIAIDLFGMGRKQVFHNNAYALNLLTELDGTPVWHYGLSRDTTHSCKSGFANLDGKGPIEIVTAQQDGLLRAFNATASHAKCPNCPHREKLVAHNHGGEVRWVYRLPSSVSDFASLDIDGDGRIELLCGCADGHLYALKESKGKCSVLWKVQLGSAVSAPVVVDLNHDNLPELLVTTADGKLHCLQLHESSSKRQKD